MRYIDDDLKIQTMNTPTHASHQVLVAVNAFGLNRADLLQRKGKYPAPSGESPVLGLEVAGEVIGCGPSVTRWKLGDKVCGLVAGGGYAEKVVVSGQHLMAVPDNLSMHAAAGLTEVFITAYQALVSIADVKPGERVLVHAGASGVGLAAIQLAQMFGCDVAVTVSSDKKQSICQAMGANLSINYNTTDYVTAIKQKWKEGVDVIIDVVGGSYIDRNMDVINMDGRMVSLAMLGGRKVEQFDLAKLLGKRISFFGSTLRNRSQQYKSTLIQDFETKVMPAFESANLKVPLDGVYSADQIAQAHERLECNDTAGKLVCYWE